MTRNDSAGGKTGQHPLSNGARDRPQSKDPLHKIPFIGDWIRGADRLRNQVPLIGERLTQADADILRMQARALRFAANQMEGRARELERLRDHEPDPRPQRIRIE